MARPPTRPPVKPSPRLSATDRQHLREAGWEPPAEVADRVATNRQRLAARVAAILAARARLEQLR